MSNLKGALELSRQMPRSPDRRRPPGQGRGNDALAPSSGPLYLPPMAMTWDSPLVAGTARELDDLLSGARLRAHLFDWDRRELHLFFRELTLRWSLHPREGWLLRHPPEDPPEAARPLSAQVMGVEAPPDERRLSLHLRKPRGRSRTWRLAVELMTNQWNALLLEGEEGRIRHLLWTRRLPERLLSVGEEYVPPPPSRRRGIESPLSMDQWQALIREAREEGRHRSFLESVAFTSSINLPALLEEEGNAGATGTGLSGHALWTRLRTLQDPDPHLLETEKGHQAYPYPLKGSVGTRLPSLLEAVAAQAGKGSDSEGRREKLLDRAEKALFRARGRVKGLERELAEAQDPQELRDRANLLLARLGRIPPGVGTVRLEGFAGEEVEVTLDPALTPQENADALYDEAARRERARAALPRLLDQAREKVGELEALKEELADGVLSPDEAEMRLPQGENEETRETPGRKTRLPYRRFRSSGGLEIRVGKQGRDNDDLTFHHSSPDHIWLHAREVRGAHVILCWEGEDNPPGRDLAEAAALAALNSKARNAGVVPVDWTRRKYVRKPRKAPAGSVLPERVQTVFVEPAPELEERLGWEE